MITLLKYLYPYLGQLKLSSGTFILFADISTIRVKLSCGKFNWMGMIWKGTRLNKRSNSWKCISEEKPRPEVDCLYSLETGLHQATHLGKSSEENMLH